jgi:CRP-like cAMP-binding protein
LKLTDEIAFFKNLQEEHSVEVHLECCKYMRYEAATEGSFVFNYGEAADKFYIIVEGSVEVRVPSPDKLQQIPISELEPGQSFGELALLRGQPRAASVYCKTMCHFATLSKTDYNRILAPAFERKLELKLGFLSELQIFKDWTRMSLSKVSLFFREKKLGRKRLLYKEGSPVTKVYLLVKGELKLFKSPSVGVRSSLINSPRQLASNIKRIEVCILSSGEFLGIEDLKEGRVHNSSCESLGTNVEYMEIDAFVNPTQDFESRVMSHPSFSYLSSRIDLTAQLRAKRFEAFNKQVTANMSPSKRLDTSTNQQLKSMTLASFSRSSKEGRVNAVSEVRRRRQPLQLEADLTMSKRDKSEGKLGLASQNPNAPAVEKQLAFNQSSPGKTLVRNSISLKRLSKQALEAKRNSCRQTLKPKLSIQTTASVPSLWLGQELEVPSFAFIKIGSLTPHTNLWEEKQAMACRTPRILRVSPRY